MIGVVAGPQTARVFQIEADAAPVARWSYPLPGDAVDVVLGAHHTHVVCEFDGLVTIHTGTGSYTSTQPSQSNWWQGGALVNGSLQLAESYVIWLDAGMGEIPETVRRLRTVDLTDPAFPTLSGSVDWPGATEALQVGATSFHGLVWDGRSLGAVTSPATLPSAVHGMLSQEQTVLAVAGDAGMGILAVASGFRCCAVAAPENPAMRVAYREDMYADGARRYAADDRWLLEGRNYHWGASAFQGWGRALTLFDLTDDTSVTVLHQTSTVDYLTYPTPLAATGGTGPGNDRVYYRLDGDEIWMSPIEPYAPRVALPAEGMFAAAAGWSFVTSTDTLFQVNCWDVAAPYLAGAFPTTGTVSAMHAVSGSTLLLGYEDGRVERYRFSGSSVDIETYQVTGAVRALGSDLELILVGTDVDVQAIHAFAIGIPDRDLGDVWPLVTTEYPVHSLVADHGCVYIAQEDRGLRMVYATTDETVDLGYGGPALETIAKARAGGNRFALVAMEADLARVLTAHCRGVQAPDELPDALLPVMTVAPNPFNPRTTVSFVLDRAQHVDLELFDLRGRRVRTLVVGHLDAGPHECSWNGRDDTGRDCSTGVYLVRLRSTAGVARAKMTLVR